MLQFAANGELPPGVNQATWEEVESLLAFNERRQELLNGLKRACISLQKSGCKRIYIGGSFATSKEFPGDFDVCWDDEYIDFIVLKQIDPTLLDFSNKRAAQKAKYGGELFPANTIADADGKTFLEFFQQNRDGQAKGVIAIDI